MIAKTTVIFLLMGALTVFFTSIGGCEEDDIGNCQGALAICDECQQDEERAVCIDEFEECSLASSNSGVQACCDRTEEIWIVACNEATL
jgi:hypothetical protein